MIRSLELTVMVDDRVHKPGLLAEHGFSCWLNTGDQSVLFDTGGGLTLEHNASALGIQLEKADALVISHGHDDHTGGIPAVLAHNPSIPIGVHSQAFSPRFTLHENLTKEHGIARPDLMSKANLVYTDQPTELLPGIWVTGTVPREYKVDRSNMNYFLDEAGTCPDSFPDDQSLFIETAAGIVVLVGCCHAGLANVLEYVAELTGHRSIYAVIGGLHLDEASGDVLDNIFDLLLEFNVQMIGMGHCTGRTAEAVLQTKFPHRCMGISTGTQLSF